MVHLPLLKLEILATRAGEISFIEIIWVGMLKISREVAGGIWYLVSFISNKEIVSPTKGRPISFEAASCFIF